MASMSGSSGGPSSSRMFQNKNVCPNHPDAHLVEDYRAGDMICSECGLVVGDRVIDVGSEWRSFSANDKNNKVGAVACFFLIYWFKCTLYGNTFDVLFVPHKSFQSTDNSRVGGPENPLLTNDLSTTMTMPMGAAAFNEDGSAKYQNR